MGVRRIVTGHDADGKAVFASDDEVEAKTLSLLPGTDFYRFWGSDKTAEFPDDGSAPSAPRYFPPVGGFRFGMFTVGPESVASVEDLDMEAAMTEMHTLLPGLAEYLEPDAPGMHTTATIDFEYVVSGRCILELDDGATREVGPGDVVVQNGTRHAWRNPFDEACVMVVVLIGAHHARVDISE